MLMSGKREQEYLKNLWKMLLKYIQKKDQNFAKSFYHWIVYSILPQHFLIQKFASLQNPREWEVKTFEKRMANKV